MLPPPYPFGQSVPLALTEPTAHAPTPWDCSAASLWQLQLLLLLLVFTNRKLQTVITKITHLGQVIRPVDQANFLVPRDKSIE
jgi:hypothetical protein